MHNEIRSDFRFSRNGCGREQNDENNQAVPNLSTVKCSISFFYLMQHHSYSLLDMKEAD